MANCIRCGAETKLYVNGSPLCVDCDNNKTASPTPKKEPHPEFAERPETVKHQRS